MKRKIALDILPGWFVSSVVVDFCFLFPPLLLFRSLPPPSKTDSRSNKRNFVVVSKHTFMIFWWSWRSWITSFPSHLLHHQWRTCPSTRTLLQEKIHSSLALSSTKFHLQMPLSILDVELAWYLKNKISISWAIHFRKRAKQNSWIWLFLYIKEILYKLICSKREQAREVEGRYVDRFCDQLVSWWSSSTLMWIGKLMDEMENLIIIG